MNVKIIILVFIGVFGGFIFNKNKLPGDAIVGAMLFTAAASILLDLRINVNSTVNTTLQALIGIVIGITFTREVLRILIKLFPVALLSTLLLSIVAIFMAYITNKLGLLDFKTAIFGFSPGGVSGMSLLADKSGLNASVVAFLHFIRVFLLFIIIPFVVRLIG